MPHRELIKSVRLKSLLLFRVDRKSEQLFCFIQFSQSCLDILCNFKCEHIRVFTRINVKKSYYKKREPRSARSFDDPQSKIRNCRSFSLRPREKFAQKPYLKIWRGNLPTLGLGVTSMVNEDQFFALLGKASSEKGIVANTLIP